MSQSLTYRADIDGLRAVAVLGVVFYHADLGFPGGYVGVDVFFVISGFLITSLLLKDLRNGTFSILDFWERRARRILPALTVVVVAILIAGWFFLLPADYEVLGKQVIALIALSSNIKFWLETGYFESIAETKPLLHTWSLSVEEQFYLLIPLFLAFFYRIRKSSWVLPLLAFSALTSFLLAIYGSYKAPSATFFLLPTRAWELAAGSLLAFVVPIESHRIRQCAAWLGLAAILVPYFFYYPGIRFPGLTALPPVAGAFLLIWSGLGSSDAGPIPLPNRILASRLFVWIGLLSYSLYLWHWPFFAFRKYVSVSNEESVIQSLFLVASSLLLAWLSLNFVERPFRSRKIIASRPVIFGLSAAALAALFGASLMIWKTRGAENRLTAEARQIAAAASDFAFTNELTLRDIPERLVRLGAPGDSARVFVWGDSHAMAILPAVDAYCKEADIPARAATASATAPVLDWSYAGPFGLKHQAPFYNAAVFDYLKNAKQHGLSHVILVGRWSYYNSVANDSGPFNIALSKTIVFLRNEGLQVVLVKEPPQFQFQPPKAMALARLLGQPTDHLATTMTDHMEHIEPQNRMFEQIREPGVQFIDPAVLYADSNGIIRPADPEGMLYRDSHHLSTYGSMRLVPVLRAALSTEVSQKNLR